MLSLPQSMPTSISNDIGIYDKDNLANTFEDLEYYARDLSMSSNDNSNGKQKQKHSDRKSKTYSIENGYSSSSVSNNNLRQTLEKTVEQSWQHQLSKSRNLNDLRGDIYDQSISKETNESQITYPNANVNTNKNKNKNICNKKHKHKHKIKHRHNKSNSKNKAIKVNMKHPITALPQLTPTDSELYGGPKPYFVTRKPTYVNPFSPNNSNHSSHSNHSNGKLFMNEKNNSHSNTVPIWHGNIVNNNNKSRKSKKQNSQSHKQINTKHKKHNKHKQRNIESDHINDSNDKKNINVNKYHIVNDIEYIDVDSVSNHNYFSHNDAVLF